MFDIFFLSYDEPDRETNWQKLSDRFPRARHIHGLKGIWRAHKACADAAATESFFLVDGDSDILESFAFQIQTTRTLDDCIFVWRAVNPVNQIVSGFGSIKLFPRSAFGQEVHGLDMTRSLGKTVVWMEEVASITRFNASPFTAWRGGFRQCAKHVLWANDREEYRDRMQRLWKWCNVGAEQAFGEYAILGARSGTIFATRNKGDHTALDLINDYQRLREIFEAEAGIVKQLP